KDTLVIPYTDNGFREHLLLLYKGEVSLYRSLHSQQQAKYYIHYQEAFFFVEKQNIAALGQEIIKTNCRRLKPYRSLNIDAMMIDMVDQLNLCLSGIVGRPIFGNRFTRWRVGLAISDVPRVQRGGAIAFNGKEYVAQMPRYSLLADWTPIRSLPWLQLDMQARMLNVNWEEVIVSENYPNALGCEGLQLTNLYFLSGPRIEVGAHSRFQLIIGGGVTTVFPLHFNRWVHFDNPQQTLPEFPLHQTLSGALDFNLGYYICIGGQMKLWRGLSVGVNIREEYLEHNTTYSDLHGIVYTERFPEGGIVPTRIGQAQLYLAYSW
ncbi:MAG: hypothetical protein AAF361_14500, partial [Bacteroidota bacterium]